MKTEKDFKTLREYDLYRIRRIKSKKSKKKIRSKTKKKKKPLSPYHKYLLSDEWAVIKLELFNYRGKICERCGSKDHIQVHHLHYKNIFKEEPEDLLILCKDCHKAEHKLN
jgi:5-methylcytosine-specific restriction endonuclease McrA